MESPSSTPTKRKRGRPPKRPPTEDAETSPSKHRVVEGRKAEQIEVSPTSSKTAPHTPSTRSRLRNEWKEQSPSDSDNQGVVDDNESNNLRQRKDRELDEPTVVDDSDSEMRIVEDSDKENLSIQELSQTRCRSFEEANGENEEDHDGEDGEDGDEKEEMEEEDIARRRSKRYRKRTVLDLPSVKQSRTPPSLRKNRIMSDEEESDEDDEGESGGVVEELMNGDDELSRVDEVDMVDTNGDTTFAEKDVAAARGLILGRLNGALPPAQLIGLDEQFKKLYGILERTVQSGEGNSVLLVGNHGCGKSTALDMALTKLRENELKGSADKLFHVVRLAGRVHVTDRLAMRSMAKQLMVEVDAEQEVKLGSSAEILPFLLSTLRSGSSNTIPIVVVLDDFDLFAEHPKQTLLYNLFDQTQNVGCPMAVVGLTARYDAVDLLEKRVKSRFSQRQIVMQVPADIHKFTSICESALSLPASADFDETYVERFNKQIKRILGDKSIVTTLRHIHQMTRSVRTTFSLFKSAISVLCAENPFLSIALVKETIFHHQKLLKLNPVPMLTLAEVMLLLSVRTYLITEHDAVNFEMAFAICLERIQRSRSSGSGTGGITFEKGFAKKAWDRLSKMKLMQPSDGGRMARHPGLQSFQLMQCSLSAGDISAGVKTMEERMPLFVRKWAVEN
ncbi:origin recognition complex subunit 4 C-terminus-domain-containing protein [Cladochytrium replicatum]|nr:origin recognition complex subunit 4 C-terminus-domain-containing protein [Cladochytrium replicatum]